MDGAKVGLRIDRTLDVADPTCLAIGSYVFCGAGEMQVLQTLHSKLKNRLAAAIRGAVERIGIVCW